MAVNQGDAAEPARQAPAFLLRNVQARISMTMPDPRLVRLSLKIQANWRLAGFQSQ